MSPKPRGHQPGDPPFTFYETDTGEMKTRNADGEWERWDVDVEQERRDD